MYRRFDMKKKMADSQCTQWLQPMPVYADTLNAMQEVAAPETLLVSNMWRPEQNRMARDGKDI